MSVLLLYRIEIPMK